MHRPEDSGATSLGPRELAYCGLFGGAALLLPVLFHLVHLGSLFMPMYLPLMALAFFVRPAPAAWTALATPLLSAALTGMPPWYPPVAVGMALELGAMAWLLASIRRRWPACNEWLLLGGVLALGRALSFAMTYGFSLLVELPAEFMASLSVVSGWPGLLLMMIVVPPLPRLAARARPLGPQDPEDADP